MTRLDSLRDGTTTRAGVPLRIRGSSLCFDVRPLAEVADEVASTVPSRWATVITPNLHHLWIIRARPTILPIYERASLLLADGWPIAALLSRTSGKRVKRATGSDLLEQLINTRVSGAPLVFVGGSHEGVLQSLDERASANGWSVWTERAPSWQIDDPVLRQALLREVAKRGAGGVVVVGFGAPRQEEFADDLTRLEGRGWVLSLGMALNFSGAGARRAPSWMARLGLEWLHRLLSEPTRLGPRYAKDAIGFLPVLAANSRRRS